MSNEDNERLPKKRWTRIELSRSGKTIHGQTGPGGFESFGVVEEVCCDISVLLDQVAQTTPGNSDNSSFPPRGLASPSWHKVSELLGHDVNGRGCRVGWWLEIDVKGLKFTKIEVYKEFKFRLCYTPFLHLSWVTGLCSTKDFIRFRFFRSVTLNRNFDFGFWKNRDRTLSLSLFFFYRKREKREREREREREI